MTRFGLERGWPAAKWSLLEERGAQSPSSPRGHFQLLRTHHKEQNGEAFPDRRLCLASLISGRGAALLLRFTFKERYVFHPPLPSLSLSLSPLLGRRCNTCVHLPSYLANFLLHPYFMANLINGCAVDDYCAGILLGTDPSTLSLVSRKKEREREKRGKMAFLVHNLIIAVQKNQR